MARPRKIKTTIARNDFLAAHYFVKGKDDQLDRYVTGLLKYADAYYVREIVEWCNKRLAQDDTFSERHDVTGAYAAVCTFCENVLFSGNAYSGFGHVGWGKYLEEHGLDTTIYNAFEDKSCAEYARFYYISWLLN